jgi:hypothetical protein
VIPQSGDIFEITSAASVQFAGDRGFTFRVINTNVLGSTPTGWIWLTGYVIDAHGDATERREIFVQIEGLISVDTLPGAQPATKPRPHNAGPARIPQQRSIRTTRSNR